MFQQYKGLRKTDAKRRKLQWFLWYVGSIGKYKLQDIILQLPCSRSINTKFHDLVLQLSWTRDININSRIHPS